MCILYNQYLIMVYYLTITTFHNGGMHNVQHSQAMLERGVCELPHFFFHFSLNKCDIKSSLPNADV